MPPEDDGPPDRPGSAHQADEIEQLRSLYEATLDATAEGILVTDLDGTVASYNDRFLEMWGIPEEAAIEGDANQLLKLALPKVADPESFQEGIQELYERPGEEIHHRIELEDGRIYERRSRPRRLDGEIVGRVSTFRNVTQSEVAERELRQALSLHRAMLDATEEGVLAVDLEGNVISCNERFLEMWGIPSEIAEASDDETLLDFAANQLEDPVSFREKVDQLYEDPQAESFDTLRFKDGRRFERVSKPQRLDGEVIGRVWSFRDVTRHARIQERLRRSEEELRNLFDNLPIGLYRTTPDGRILLANQALAEMLGYEDAEAIMTRNLEEDDQLFEPDYSREAFRRQLREEDEIRGLEARWTRRDGETLAVRESARVVRDDADRILYYEGTVEDVTDRVQAEEELRASEERYRRLVELSPVALVVHDGRRILYANPSAAEALGVEDPREVEDRDPAEFVHPDHREAVADRMRQVMREGEEVELQRERFLREDGKEILVEATAMPIEIEEARMAQVAFRDVTERVEAQRALEASKQRLSTVLAEAPVLLVSLDTDGEVTFVEGTGLAEFGLEPEDIVGRNALDVELLNDATRDAIEQALNGSPAQSLLPVEDRWVQVQMVPVDEGGLEGVIGVVVDITDRKRVEEELRESRQFLETLVTRAPVIVSMLDPEGRITYVTGSGLDALDVEPSELIGTDAFDAFPDNDEHHENLRRALSGEQTTETIQVGDQWLQIESVPIFDAEGDLEAVIRVGMDVTARKRAEQEVRELNETLEQRVADRTAELRAAKKEIEAFSASISHDLRGPLQTIDGFSQILLEDHADGLDGQAVDLLERMRGASQTIDRRIEGLLSIAREARKPLDRETVDLSAAAERILDDLARADPRREVAVEVEAGLTARADPELTEALLENLLRNAWKFTSKEDDPVIEVTGRQEDGETVFCVADNGVGFDPEHADQLFEPFQRQAGDAFEGTGVGLASVQRIVQRHGGWIEAEGEPGEGARFRFTLPGG